MTDAARPPAVAGSFYPEGGEALAHLVESCFLDARGPGALPEHRRRPERRIVAAVVPHAGLVYSGAIAAHAYARIAAERPPESVVILGVDHHGASRGAALSARPWTTPLGPTAIDPELVGALRHGPVEVDEAAHRREHSIEVQLPFLEYVLPKPSFAPLMVRHGPYGFLEEVAAVVRSATAGRDALLLASTDFSHYVPPETAARLDGLAIDAILERDPRKLYDVVEQNDISMCGIAPTTVLLAALKDRPLTATLLRWGHSGEVAPGPEVVGYAAIVLEAADAPAPVK
jgi:AmmeMemoRadiSam system protein B